MKKILIGPIIAATVIAIIHLFFGNGFEALLWLLVSFIFSVTLLPIVINMDDKDVPVLQIFASLLFLIIIFSVAAFLDFRKNDFTADKALLYGIGIGFSTIIAIMLLKEKK